MTADKVPGTGPAAGTAGGAAAGTAGGAAAGTEAGAVPGAPVVDSASALLAMLGGTRGMLDSAIPGLLFVSVFIATRQLAAPAAIALSTGLAIFVYRLIKRDTLRHAAAGLAGVAVAAGLAVLTGKPENYFVPALAMNVGYTALSAISLAARWPLAGLILGAVFGEGQAWRADATRRRTYTMVTWLWFGMFAVRAAVLAPLWLTGQLVPLGVARVALGYPLYALAIWLTWLTLSATQPVRADVSDDGRRVAR